MFRRNGFGKPISESAFAKKPTIISNGSTQKELLKRVENLEQLPVALKNLIIRLQAYNAKKDKMIEHLTQRIQHLESKVPDAVVLPLPQEFDDHSGNEQTDEETVTPFDTLLTDVNEITDGVNNIEDDKEDMQAPAQPQPSQSQLSQTQLSQTRASSDNETNSLGSSYVMSSPSSPSFNNAQPPMSMFSGLHEARGDEDTVPTSKPASSVVSASKKGKKSKEKLRKSKKPKKNIDSSSSDDDLA
jgi:hypothetical protein